MTTIGPVLFWCLFVWFGLNGVAAVLLECSRGRANAVRLESPGTYTIRALIALGFCVALGVARW